MYDVPVRRNGTLLLAFVSGALLLPAQQVTLPLWPNGTPEPWHVDGPERDVTKPSDAKPGGRGVIRLADISKPTLAVYPAADSKNSAAAALVFPGGGYQRLAYDLEGTEVCDWLNSIGMTCVLVKYRVPVKQHYPDSMVDLEDAQQAMRLTRAHASEWHIDPNRIGVIGFSAGGHLAAVLSNHPDKARPDFAMLIYPAYLRDTSNPSKIAPSAQPSANTPPTFLVQAENDPVHEENALLYFQALKEVKVPAELHIFAEGGHGYGLRPTNLPVTHWPSYAETWLHTIHVLGNRTASP